MSLEALSVEVKSILMISLLHLCPPYLAVAQQPSPNVPGVHGSVCALDSILLKAGVLHPLCLPCGKGFKDCVGRISFI